MGNEWLADVGALAARHHGIFAAPDAEELGVSRRQLARAAAVGVLARVHPNVFAFSGTPLGRLSLIAAAVLQTDRGVASHESALYLHGIHSVPDVVAVTVPRGEMSHVVEGVRVHRARDIRPDHLTTIDGIATTTIERAIVDVTSVVSSARLAHLIDHVTITRRATSIAAIFRTLRQVNRKGRKRIATLSRLLDDRSPGEPAPRGRLERRVDHLLSSIDLPTPVAEYPMPTDGRYRGYVDRAWPEAMLILEIDGRTWHARESSMATDRGRDREAARHGWQTLRVLDEEIEADPHGVVRDLVATFERRVGQLRAAV
jgi:hypothetical protein